MDAHVKKISKLCRLCGKTVITGKGYVNAKTIYNYDLILSTYFRISVDEDKEVAFL